MPPRGDLDRERDIARLAPGHLAVKAGMQQNDAGDDVPMFYDPLIGKLVSFGADRQGAIEQMLGALDDIVLEGPKSNIETHRRVLTDERFVSGSYDTGLLGK